MENQAKHLVVVVVVEKARTAELAEMVKLTLHGPPYLLIKHNIHCIANLRNKSCISKSNESELLPVGTTQSPTT
jgi:hypothetical protein